MGVNFISSRDRRETHSIYVSSDNEEIRSGNETEDIIKRLPNFFLHN